MKHEIDDPQVRHYLAALKARLYQLPADQFEEIVFGVREHIADALERGGQSVDDILAGLGSPDDIATGLATPDAPGPGQRQPIPFAQQPTQRPQSSILWLVGTCILLPFGGFVVGIGWLLGVAGLWMGMRWQLWEKVMGTILIPGGVPAALLLAGLPVRQTLASSGPEGEVIISDYNPLGFSLPEVSFVIILALPILAALYLLIVGLVRGSRQP